MKKYIVLVLTLSMLLSLCACASSESKIKGEVHEISEAPVIDKAKPKAEDEAEPEAELEIGRIAGGRYESKYFGLGCELDESWIYLTREEMAELIGITADMFEDESYAQSVKSADMFYDMYAATEDGTKSINILVQNLGLIYGSVLSEEEYVELSTQGLDAQLESAGFEDVKWEKQQVSLGGQEYQGLRISSTVQGIAYYCTQAYVKQGSHMAVITFASYFEDTTEELAESFFVIE